MEKRSALLYILVSFVLVYFFQHGDHTNEPAGGPEYEKQTFYVSLTHNFATKKLVFQKPEVSEKQLEQKDENTGSYGAQVTAAFPIHNYLPAVISNKFAVPVIDSIRWYNLLYGFVGLYFLFMLSLRVSNHLGKSLLVVIFMASTPLFAHFHSGLLPVIPALANAMIALYFVYRSTQSKKMFHYGVGLVFAFLSSITNAEFSIVFIALAIEGAFQFLPKKNRNLKWIGVVAPLIGLWLWQMFTISEQAQLYPSIEPSLFGDLADTTGKPSIHDWSSRYFSILHLLLFGGVIIAAFIFRTSTIKEVMLNRVLIVISILALVLSLSNPTRMFYEPHYVLELWWMPLVLLLLLSLQRLRLEVLDRYPKVLYPALVILMLALLSEGNWTQLVDSRDRESSDSFQFVSSYEGSDELLAHLQVPKSARLLVAIPRNYPAGNEILIKLNRSGFIWRYGLESLATYGEIAPDYFIVNRQTEEILRKEYGSLFGMLHLVGSNNSVHVYEVRKKLQ